MKKVRFIYNPYSGENTILYSIDKVIKVHQKHGYLIEPFRIDFNSSMADGLKDINKDHKYILIAGGDGTIDSVVNSMKELNINLPIGILPVGTANDFARLLKIPENIEDACEEILNSTPRKIDIGKINDKYFVNVASAGLFTEVAHKTDVNLKNTMGKLAYYVKGFEQIPNLRSIHIKADSAEYVFDEGMYLILVFNGKTAGSFNLAYKSEIDDGYLDVIIIKSVMIFDIINIFVKILLGEHLEEVNGVVYFKTKEVRVECDEDISSDIDGELGPSFPVDIKCIEGGLEILGFNAME